MKTHTCEGVGCYTYDEESARFETNDRSVVDAFTEESGVDAVSDYVASAFDTALVDIGERIEAGRESSRTMDRDCPMQDGGSWSSVMDDEPYEREMYERANAEVDAYRNSTGRKWPPVYRVKIVTEAEEVSAEETEKYWLERIEKTKWWKQNPQDVSGK